MDSPPLLLCPRGAPRGRSGHPRLPEPPRKVDLTTCKRVYPGETYQACSCTGTADRLQIAAQPERGSSFRPELPITVAVLDGNLDFGKGIVLEGTIQATCRDRRLTASSVGSYLEEKPGEGTAILLRSYGRTEIAKMTTTDRVLFRPEDTIAPGCAAPAGIVPHTNHPFRLMVRKNMFELYLDDMFVQTFNTTHDPGNIGLTPQRIGFIVENGLGLFENVTVAPMTLDE